MAETEWNRFLGVILRVPSLFVLDELFRAAFGMAAYYPHWEGEDTSAVTHRHHDKAPLVVEPVENATESVGGGLLFANATNASVSSSRETVDQNPKEALAFLSIAVPFLLSLTFHILAGIAACIIFVLRINKLKVRIFMMNTFFFFLRCSPEQATRDGRFKV